MSKKMMLLALAVVSAVVFALPAGASAQEIHMTGVESFSGTSGAATLTAQEEPVITCGAATTLNHTTIIIGIGGTTGSILIVLTGCHTSVFGFTAKCHSSGSAADSTVESSGTFHFITTNETPKILVTPVETTIVCAGISNTKVAGNVIGTITSPACGVASNNMTIRFSASGATQEDKSYTGVNYNLTSQTGTGTIKEAGLVSESTVSSATAGTLDCT